MTKRAGIRRSSLPSRGAVPHLPEGVTVNDGPRCHWCGEYFDPDLMEHDDPGQDDHWPEPQWGANG
jgi:hypothetical protein